MNWSMLIILFYIMSSQEIQHTILFNFFSGNSFLHLKYPNFLPFHFVLIDLIIVSVCVLNRLFREACHTVLTLIMLFMIDLFFILTKFPLSSFQEKWTACCNILTFISTYQSECILYLKTCLGHSSESTCTWTEKMEPQGF